MARSPPRSVQTTDTAAAEDVIDSLEQSLKLHVELGEELGNAGSVGGGSRPGDVAAELPEGTNPLGRKIQYPKEVANFLKRYPKVRATPESVATLDTLFGHTKSGALSISPRAGRYEPIRTRAAAAEFESIIELSSRPEVESIELVPQSSTKVAGLDTEGRTADKIVDIRQLDGTVVRSRWEDTTITGARTGYRPRGKGGRGTPNVNRIRAAIRGKVESTPARPSQFDALMAEAPEGGTLAVHIQRPGQGGAQDVADAMAHLPELSNSSVDVVEFFLPGQQPLRRQVLRYGASVKRQLCPC